MFNYMKVSFLIIAVMLSGCNQSQTPADLLAAEKPLTLLSKGDRGILISDANGKIYAYSNSFYFAVNIMASGLENGDTLTVKTK